MTFEEELGELSAHFFFQEFSYSNNTFSPTPDKEVELADHILWIDDAIVLFQLKERQVDREPTPEGEARWFARKVLARATKQVRDTLGYLEVNDQIQVKNHRGHQRSLYPCHLNVVHKVVCYLPSDELPAENRSLKFHRSETAGIVHLVRGDEYVGIVRTLLTPAEFMEYLGFREELIGRWESRVNEVAEDALVGQYLSGDLDAVPSAMFAGRARQLKDSLDEWDMSGVIKNFPERVTSSERPTDYYPIVSELAKLKRNELKEFKERFQLSMEKCRADESVPPYRIACPRTSCGFLFIPIESEFRERRTEGLKNLTYACKYDLDLPKCVGISFAPEDDGWYSVEWCYMEFPCTYDAEMEKWLNDLNPFRSVRTVELQRYQYGEEEQ